MKLVPCITIYSSNPPIHTFYYWAILLFSDELLIQRGKQIFRFVCICKDKYHLRNIELISSVSKHEQVQVVPPFMKVQVHTLNLALDGGKQSPSHPICFFCEGVPDIHWTRGWVALRGSMGTTPLPGTKP
jgi:hypothetical protein